MPPTSETVVGPDGRLDWVATKGYYNEAGAEQNLKTVADALGQVTTYEYNGRYQVTRVLDPLHGDPRWQPFVRKLGLGD